MKFCIKNVYLIFFLILSLSYATETLGKDKLGWSSVVYETYQECTSKARMFNEDPEYRDKIKAKCERAEK